MKKINFYEYLPQRFAATSEQIVKVRNLIYNFKSGRKEAANYAADLIVRLMWNWYGHKCNEYTIVCVPASSNAEYRHRFSYFSHVVACRCQQENAMKHIQILGSVKLCIALQIMLCRITATIMLFLIRTSLQGARLLYLMTLLQQAQRRKILRLSYRMQGQRLKALCSLLSR